MTAYPKDESKPDRDEKGNRGNMRSENARVRVYDHRTSAYRRAFDSFLEHTDQKRNAKAWLLSFTACLERRGVFVDAGAGNGQVTSWLAPHFERTIAVEPNDELRREMEGRLAGPEVIAAPIAEAAPSARGDLVLCSHVLYYVPSDEWFSTVERLAEWTSPWGALVLVLQNQDTDCMRMLEHFLGRRFDLRALGGLFAGERGDEFAVDVQRGPAEVRTRGLEDAVTIAEFMLNLLPIREYLDAPPARESLEAYVRENFSDGEAGFRFSCDQDFLVIWRRAGLERLGRSSIPRVGASATRNP